MFDRLGETLTVLRILHRLSQAELASRAGIRANQASRYETGRVLPQLPQLERLLVALGVGLPELFYTLLYVERCARLVEKGQRDSPESIAQDAMVARWRELADHQGKESGHRGGLQGVRHPLADPQPGG